LSTASPLLYFVNVGKPSISSTSGISSGEMLSTSTLPQEICLLFLLHQASNSECEVLQLGHQGAN
jgi:hypothetical protein